MSQSSVKKPLSLETKTRLESAVRKLFSQQDFHQVNMRAIARETGIGLNTIYMHYESKERLLFAFVDEWIQHLDEQIALHLQGLENIKEKIRKIVWVILDFYERNPEIGIIVIMTVPFKTWMADETFKQKGLSMRIINILKDGQEKKILDPEISAYFMFDVLFGIIHRIVYMWFYQKQKESITENANACFKSIWRAIEQPKSPASE